MFIYFVFKTPLCNYLYDYIFAQSAFFNLSFVWKEVLHDQGPVIATVYLGYM